MKKLLSAILALVMLMSFAYAQEVPNLNRFTATDIDGNEWTEAIFEDYDLTMITIWATWCAACVSDVPRLINLKNSLPENVNLITICDDGQYEDDLARQIMVENGANYITLLSNREIYDKLLSGLQAIPTTIFVDSQGNILAESTVAANSTNHSQVYLETIDQLLAELPQKETIA